MMNYIIRLDIEEKDEVAPLYIFFLISTESWGGRLGSFHILETLDVFPAFLTPSIISQVCPVCLNCLPGQGRKHWGTRSVV